MPRAVSSLLAVVAAIALVVGAVFARSALDRKRATDSIRVRLTCDPLLADACHKVADDDHRLTVLIEAPTVTRARLVRLQPGQDPGLDAWATVGPWMAMTDGARSGQPPIAKSTRSVASSRVTLIAKASLGTCAPTPLACPVDKIRNVGMQPPTDDGVALAATAWIVAKAAKMPILDLDRNGLASGPAADSLRDLKSRVRPSGLEVVNAGFAQAQVVVTTAAAARAVPAGSGTPLTTDVSAVAEISFLTASASGALSVDSVGGRAIRTTLAAAGWDDKPSPSGLPDPGVLAALQEAWPSA